MNIPTALTLSRPARFLDNLGKPIIALIVILFALALWDRAQAMASLVATLESLSDIAPFIVLSVVLAASLRSSSADQIISRMFRYSPQKSLWLAAVFGALSPFCSCGVVPIMAGLLASGVPIAPVLAFCLASPIIDPEMFILTAATLGLEFAMVKLVGAMFIGIMAGYIALVLDQTGWLEHTLKHVAAPCCGTQPKDEKVVWRFWNDPARRRTFTASAQHSGLFMVRWLSLAFLLESLMIAYIPAENIATLLGNNNIWAIPLATLVGIPAYMNGYAGIPLIRGLLDLGMSAPTGMAFLLAGSVTSIPAALAVWTMFKPRMMILYATIATSGSMLVGIGYALYR